MKTNRTNRQTTATPHPLRAGDTIKLPCGTRARVLEDAVIMQPGDRYCVIPGQWPACTQGMFGEAVGAIFARPRGDVGWPTIPLRLRNGGMVRLLLNGTVVRPSTPNQRKSAAAMVRSFARWIGLPVSPSKPIATAATVLLCLCALLLGGCATYGPAKPYQQCPRNVYTGPQSRVL